MVEPWFVGIRSLRKPFMGGLFKETMVDLLLVGIIYAYNTKASQ